tara:strand:+ start:4288 stop:6153 length:1866 start_codon:yes stop_codon:yes gene_type:complete
MSFFSKTRIKATELFQDAFRFLQEKYDQAVETFTPASPFGQILTVVANLGELIFFYIEAVATESNISRARNIESIYGLSRLTGHDPTRGISARGIIGIRLNQMASEIPGDYVQINRFAKCKVVNNDQKYFLNFDSDFIRLEKSNPDFINVELIQGERDTQKFTGTGRDIQAYNLTTTDATDQHLVTVTVDAERYEIVESLYDMDKGAKAVLVKTSVNGGLSIFFGNQQFGFPPPLGSIIEVDYVKTRGSSGNVGGSGITLEFEDPATDQQGEDVDLNKFLQIKIVRNPSLGSNSEDPDLTRLIAPSASRSFVLANPDNYIYFLRKYDFFSFINAYNTKDDQYLDDDNIIYLFLIPDIQKKLTTNLDYFTVPEDEFSLTADEKEQVKEILNESGRQVVTAEVRIVDPKIKRYAVNIILRYFENFDKAEIRNSIRKTLNDYFLSVKRRDRIPRSDLVALIEQTPGVDSVSVFFVSQENEDAIRNGYYFVPVFGTDPATDQQVLIENKKIVLEQGEDPGLGLDSFGDIVIGEQELAIIRGGWEDRQGNYYNDVPEGNKIGPLNVFFKDTVPNDLYSNLQQNAFNNLRRNRGTTPAISSNAPTTSTRTTGQLGGPNTLTDSNYGT